MHILVVSCLCRCASCRELMNDLDETRSMELLPEKLIVPQLVRKFPAFDSILYNFYLCTVHFEIYVVHSPTNALFINLVKSFKFTLKYTIISLLHVSVFNDHHQRAFSVPNYIYIYVKTLGKITSLYI